jgi:hypothetical protein
LAATVTACGEEPIAPEPRGSVVVQTTTTGGDLDPDGYLIFVDGVEVSRVGPNGRMSVGPLNRRERSVELRGLTSNCVVVGDNPRSVVPEAAGVTVTFEVSCTATGVVVVTSTIGVDTPHAHVASILPDSSVSVPINGSLRVGYMPPGTYSVLLVPGGGNCSIAAPNPVELTIGAGENPEVAFSVTCLAIGEIEISTVTSGWDAVATYAVFVDGVGPRSPGISRNGSLTIQTGTGDHVIALSGLPTNCTASGGTSRNVSVSAGGLTRDTAKVAFDIHCERLWDLALTRRRGDGDHVYLVGTAGGGERDLGRGFDAEWSADGRAVVFTRLTTCIPYYSFYYYYGCPNRGLTVASTEGEEPVDITFGETDAGGTWHPDGESIAFTRGGQLHLVGRAGGGVTPILLPPGVHASDPSWSPDGASLAFTCEFESGNRDVCVVGSGGSGFSRLTDDPAHDAGPDWSPDGSSIAFVTSRFSGVTELALMPSAGGLPTRVSAGTPAARPSWLDASTLVFAGVQCDVYAGCTPHGVFRVSLDGSGLTQLTTDADHEPSWRP